METAPSTVKSWPGAFGILNESKKVVLSNWQPLLILAIVSTLANTIGNRESDSWILSLFASIVAIVTGVALVYGLLQATKGTKVSLGQAMKFALSMTSVRYFLMAILSILIILASLLALIIPVFFVAPRLALAEMFLIDQGMGPLASIKASWAATRGHVGKLYGILGVYILFAIACFVLVGFYLLFVYMATLPLLYRFALDHTAHNMQTSTPPNTPTPIA